MPGFVEESMKPKRNEIVDADLPPIEEVIDQAPDGAIYECESGRKYRYSAPREASWTRVRDRKPRGSQNGTPTEEQS